MQNTIKHSSNKLWLFLILLSATFLRIYQLSSESIWVDEIYTLRIARKEFWDVVTNYDVHPALYYTIMHFWIKVFGQTEFGIRLFSVVVGTLTVWMLYRVGKLMFGRQSGLIAAGLLAFSSFHITYSQDARSYALLAFFAAASVYFYIKILKNGKISHWIGHAVCTLILLYIHNFSTLIVFFQNLHYFWLVFLSKKGNKPSFLKWFGQELLLFLLYLPWIFYSLKYSKELSGNFWIERPVFKDIIETIREYAGGYKALGLYFFAFILSAKAVFFEENSKRRWLLFLAGWMILTLSIPFAVSLVWTPIYYTRYTLGTSLAFYLAAAFLISQIRFKKIKVAVLILLFALSCGALNVYYGHVKKEQWRDVTAFVDSSARPSDFALFHLRGTEIFEYYTQKRNFYSVAHFPPRRVAGVVPEREKHVTSENIDKLLPIVEGHNRVWFMLSHSRDKDHLIEAKLKEKYRLVLEKEFYQIKVFLFEKNS